MKINWKWLLRLLILIIVYVLLGNSRSIQPNPFIPGAIIAVNMVIPVIAGILFGSWTGFLVGIFGTFLNSLTPAGSFFEFLAILPHGIMGFLAGYFRGKLPSPILSLSLIIGHLLNIFMFTISDMLPIASLMNITFWYALAYEGFIGIITILVIIGIYRIGFERK